MSPLSSESRFASLCGRNCGTDGVEGSRLMRTVEPGRCVWGSTRVGVVVAEGRLGVIVVVVVAGPVVVVVPGPEVAVVDPGPVKVTVVLGPVEVVVVVVVVVVEGGMGVIEESSS